MWGPRLLNEVIEEVPTCECCKLYFNDVCCSLYFADTMIEAPPSVIPHKHLCDITGLEVRVNFVTSYFDTEQSRQAPYTDPTTGLRYHDKSVYEIIKGLVSPIHRVQKRSLLTKLSPRAQVLQRIICQVRTVINHGRFIQTYRL